MTAPDRITPAAESPVWWQVFGRLFRRAPARPALTPAEPPLPPEELREISRVHWG